MSQINVINRSNNHPLNRWANWRASLAVVLAILLWPGLTGCTSQPATTTGTLPTTTEKASVTAFGTVQSAETLTLALPAAVRVVEWYAVAGQAIPPHTAVLKIDWARLQLAADQQEQELAGLQNAQASYTLQNAAAIQAIDRIRAAADALDIEKALGLLDALARSGSRTRRQACEADLLAYLEEAGSLDLYHSLAALTADRYSVQSNARPVLLQRKADLASQLQTRIIQQLDLERQIHLVTSSLLLQAAETAIMKAICTGQMVSGCGSFDSAGVLTTGDRPLLLNRRADGSAEVAAGSRLAEFVCLDRIQLLVNIEEQLIAGVKAGAEVQISPLYNKSVVWLGTVQSVSDRAELVNGETVIPVIITTDERMTGPGYNVAVKIKIQDG